MEKNDQSFEYTYSAAQRDEIRKIREKYLPKARSKMDQLRELDQKVTRKGMALSLTMGTLSALGLGIGMCCTMVWSGGWFVPGVVIGIVGIAGVSAAYPLYTRITRKERERIAPEVLRLTEELMTGQA